MGLKESPCLSAQNPPVEAWGYGQAEFTYMPLSKMANAYSVYSSHHPLQTAPSPPNETRPQQSLSMPLPPASCLWVSVQTSESPMLCGLLCLASHLVPCSQLSHLAQPSTAGLVRCFPQKAPTTAAALMPEFPLSWEHSWDWLGHMVALGSWPLLAGSCPVIPPRSR